MMPGTRTAALAMLAGVFMAGAEPSTAEDAGARDAAIAARTHRSPIPAAYHEFRVFGENAIYLSHYAMFASIHAYQVIFEARLSADGIDAEKTIHDFQRAHPERHLTLSPSLQSAAADRKRHDWVLPEEIKAGRRFNADLHWVENPDDFSDPSARRYVATNVTVDVVRLIHFRMFYPDNVRPDQLLYIAFGQGTETYLAHRLEAHPDFDQIVRVRLNPSLPPDATGVRFEDRGNTSGTRLKAGERVAAEFIGDDGIARGPAQVEIVDELQFEDLEIQK